jgi:hypothetical protein
VIPPRGEPAALHGTEIGVPRGVTEPRARAQALQAMGTTFTTFSFLQGLYADIDVLAEVPA